MKKSISAQEHRLIVYSFSTLFLLLPKVLNLKRSSRNFSYGFSVGLGSKAAFQEVPASLKSDLPLQSSQYDVFFKGDLSKMFMLSLATGSLRQTSTRPFFIGALLGRLTDALLTEWQKSRNRSAQEKD